jgi:TrmH family RNA methyltransferase
MTPISSPHNPVVKYVRSLERARVRREEKAYIAEGVRLVREALATGQRARIVLYDPALLSRSAAGTELLTSVSGWAERAYEVAERVLSAVAWTESPAGVVAVLALPVQADLSLHEADPFGVLLDGLADPGNAGTILRTADAAGVSYVCALPGTVDLFAPKVVRAGMGAHFRVPLYQDVDWQHVDAALSGVTIVTTSVRAGESVFDARWPERYALVIGSEAHGLSEESRVRAAMQVHIPMREGVESLNASVAASIAIYAARGRQIRPT